MTLSQVFEQIRIFFERDWLKLVNPLLALLVTLAVCLALKRLVFRVLRRWADRVPTQTRTMLVQAFGGIANVWIVIFALHVAFETSEVSERVARLGGRTLLVLWVVSLTVVAARLAGSLIRYYGQQSGGALPVTTLSENLAGLSVSILGALLLMHLLGVSIAPLLTALGVGGLAVALALQDTLSNLFAGFYISIAGQMRPGDYIRLEGGQEGYITDITWRSTTIRSLANNMVIVPNAKLAQAIVTNYHLPAKSMSVSITVNVGYDADADLVERVLLEEAMAAGGAVKGLLTEPAPSVRLIPGFGETYLIFSLNCHVEEFVDQYLAQHELRKRVLRRLRQECVPLPPAVRQFEVRSTPAGPAA
jgi:small-conductance mechanosensitive channel